jgi:hypothetical protein
MMKTVLPARTKRRAFVLSYLLWIGSGACSFTHSMNPYRGSTAKLLPLEVGKFQRAAEPRDLNPAQLNPEMAKGLLNAAVVRYIRVDGPPSRNVGTSAYSFASSERAKEFLQVARQSYVKQGYKISEESTRKRGWWTVGDRIVFTHEPGKDRYPNGQTYSFWRNGSVVFYAEAFSESQLEDVMDFVKSFPY